MKGILFPRKDITSKNLEMLVSNVRYVIINYFEKTQVSKVLVKTKSNR